MKSPPLVPVADVADGSSRKIAQSNCQLTYAVRHENHDNLLPVLWKPRKVAFAVAVFGEKKAPGGKASNAAITCFELCSSIQPHREYTSGRRVPACVFDSRWDRDNLNF